MPDTVNKYTRIIHGIELGDDYCLLVDVYQVLEAFGVTCPARQHAIKKLLCAGLRGKGDTLQDLREAANAVGRAIELQMQRNNQSQEKNADKELVQKEGEA